MKIISIILCIFILLHTFDVCCRPFLVWLDTSSFTDWKYHILCNYNGKIFPKCFVNIWPIKIHILRFCVHEHYFLCTTIPRIEWSKQNKKKHTHLKWDSKTKTKISNHNRKIKIRNVLTHCIHYRNNKDNLNVNQTGQFSLNCCLNNRHN